MNERQCSEISIPDMTRGSGHWSGEFHDPKREPVQLIHYDPNRNSYVSEPPLETATCTDTDFDQNAAPTYLQWSEISSKKREYYDEIDNYAAAKRQQKKQNPCSIYLPLFVALLALALGLGGVGLGLYQYLFVSSSDCSCNDQVNITALEVQLALSQAQIEELQATVANLNINTSKTTEHPTGYNSTRVEQLEQQVEEIRISLLEIQEPSTVTEEPSTTTQPNATEPGTMAESNTTEELNTTVVSTFKEVSPYENCTTTKLRSCSISSSLFSLPPSFGTCQTTPPATRNIDGFYNLGFYCAITNPRTEQNPIITTLQVDEDNNEVRCLCYVDVNNNDFTRVAVECALYATRCPYTLYIPTYS